MHHLIREAQQYLMNTYTRQPLVIDRGEGTRVFDSNGKDYLDFVSGVAVNNLGHCHPDITDAVCEQTRRLVHVSNLYYNEPQIKLARLLVENSFADKIFFCNSGTEAVEAAIKLARKFSFDRHGPGRHEIISCEQSFHGRTLAALTATGQRNLHKGFEPLVPGFRHIPFNDLKAAAKAVSEKTIALLVEPIQGEGGVRIPDDNYLPGLRKLCDEQGLLLILDEVQTGIGRTGKMFCYEHYGIKPDIMTLAKGMGNGFPIGALLAREDPAGAFTPGSHASTFGGNPLACSAALATLQILLKNPSILENCRRMGDYLMGRLKELQKRHSHIISVRGKGLLIGAEIAMEGQSIVQDFLKEGILINCTMGRVLRFVPPLTASKDDMDRVIHCLDSILKKVRG